MEWEHEDASVMMLDYLIDQNNIDLAKEDINFVQRLIKGQTPSRNDEKRKDFQRFTYLLLGWMFDIVANKTNSLDVDKFDYL